MTLEEVRKEIDAIDSQMKPLFLKRMECSRHVAEAKAKNGGDVFSKAREDEIINKRAADVNAEVREELAQTESRDCKASSAYRQCPS